MDEKELATNEIREHILNYWEENKEMHHLMHVFYMTYLGYTIRVDVKNRIVLTGDIKAAVDGDKLVIPGWADVLTEWVLDDFTGTIHYLDFGNLIDFDKSLLGVFVTGLNKIRVTANQGFSVLESLQYLCLNNTRIDIPRNIAIHFDGNLSDFKYINKFKVLLDYTFKFHLTGVSIRTTKSGDNPVVLGVDSLDCLQDEHILELITSLCRGVWDDFDDIMLEVCNFNLRDYIIPCEKVSDTAILGYYSSLATSVMNNVYHTEGEYTFDSSKFIHKLLFGSYMSSVNLLGVTEEEMRHKVYRGCIQALFTQETQILICDEKFNSGSIVAIETLDKNMRYFIPSDCMAELYKDCTQLGEVMSIDTWSSHYMDEESG